MRNLDQVYLKNLSIDLCSVNCVPCGVPSNLQILANFPLSKLPLCITIKLHVDMYKHFSQALMKLLSQKYHPQLYCYLWGPCPLHWNSQGGSSFSLPSFVYCLGTRTSNWRKADYQEKRQILVMHTHRNSQKNLSQGGD